MLRAGLRGPKTGGLESTCLWAGPRPASSNPSSGAPHSRRSDHRGTRSGYLQGALRQFRQYVLLNLCSDQFARRGWPWRCSHHAGRKPRTGGPRRVTINLVQAWQGARRRLEAAGLAGPVIDARLLVEAAADVTRVEIVTDPYRALSPEQEARLESYLARREHREPVSQILGRKGFWKIMLNVTRDVLSPRPD